MMKISPFRFKQFSVWHHRSALKVGVDGVLIGCWVDVSEAQSIIDVGTGCGLIALIMAQRRSDAKIIGIEIDYPSVEEARQNIEESPWSDRISIIHGGFPEDLGSDKLKEINLKYDLVVSNPPFFDSGIDQTSTRRERARHQGKLSPESLLTDSLTLLNDNGSVAMIVPIDQSIRLEEIAESLGYKLHRKCIVRGHKEAPFKRCLLQWDLKKHKSHDGKYEEAQLTLESSPGIPTDAYRALCHDFYLRF